MILRLFLNVCKNRLNTFQLILATVSFSYHRCLWSSRHLKTYPVFRIGDGQSGEVNSWTYLVRLIIWCDERKCSGIIEVWDNRPLVMYANQSPNYRAANFMSFRAKELNAPNHRVIDLMHHDLKWHHDIGRYEAFKVVVFRVITVNFSFWPPQEIQI